MDTKMLENILEEQGLTQEQMVEIMAEIAEIDMGVIDPTMPQRELIGFEQREIDLRQAMDKETDWRKKAAIAARILSIHLE